MDENFECYYCPMATEDLKKCIDHVIAEHGDKALKLNENTENTEWCQKPLVSYQTMKCFQDKRQS